jgi:hypothetical protein
MLVDRGRRGSSHGAGISATTDILLKALFD